MVEDIIPAVVNITTRQMVAQGADDVIPRDLPIPDTFREFLERNPDLNPQPRPATALGSGFLIGAEGYIVTNNHVVDGAEEVLIQTFEDEQFTAEVVGTDPRTDIAALKIEADVDLPYVEFGDSDPCARW